MATVTEEKKEERFIWVGRHSVHEVERLAGLDVSRGCIAGVEGRGFGVEGCLF